MYFNFKRNFFKRRKEIESFKPRLKSKKRVVPVFRTLIIMLTRLHAILDENIKFAKAKKCEQRVLTLRKLDFPLILSFNFKYSYMLPKLFPNAP